MGIWTYHLFAHWRWRAENSIEYNELHTEFHKSVYQNCMKSHCYLFIKIVSRSIISIVTIIAFYVQNFRGWCLIYSMCRPAKMFISSPCNKIENASKFSVFQYWWAGKIEFVAPSFASLGTYFTDPPPSVAIYLTNLKSIHVDLFKWNNYSFLYDLTLFHDESYIYIDFI